MLGKKSLLGGLFGVFFLSIAAFFVIYLFVPDVSLKFFGIAFGSDEYIESSVAQMIRESGIPASSAEEIIAYIQTDEGRRTVNALLGNAADNLSSMIESFSSDDARRLLNEAAGFISRGEGSIADFFHSLAEGAELPR